MIRGAINETNFTVKDYKESEVEKYSSLSLNTDLIDCVKNKCVGGVHCMCSFAYITSEHNLFY